MNHPDFSYLRRLLDEAITFNDLEAARRLSTEGVALGMKKELPSEELYFRAQLAVISGSYEEAEQYLKNALVINPADGAAYNDIALCMLERGLIEGVLELFDKGIAVESDYATIHHNKGWFLNNLGQHESALKCFERALTLDPERAVTMENMAVAYEALGRIPEALQSYRSALPYIKEPFTHVRLQIKNEIERLENAKD